MEIQRVYDGAFFCDKCDKCPVVDHNKTEGTVSIFDPHKPENGRMKMTVDEFNLLIKNVSPII